MLKVCLWNSENRKRSKSEPKMGKILLLIGLILTVAVELQAQALAPALHPQYVDTSGNLLAGGFLYTYAAGTTTQQATYADALATIQNSNPIPLDATGAPSNTSGAQVQIWLSNTSYKFCAYNSSMVLQWCWDNVSSYQILNNLLSLTLTGVTSDPSGVAGLIDYRSDLPCFRSYTTSWDCFVRAADIQTLTNKTINIGANTITNTTNTAGHYPRNNGSAYVDSAIQAADLPVGGVIANGVFGCVNNVVAPYTVKSTDEACLLIVNGSAVTLPSASFTTGFGAGNVFHIKSAIGGVPTTVSSSSSFDNSTHSYTLFPGQTAAFWSDGINYNLEPGNPLPGVVYNTPSTAVSANIPATTMVTSVPSTGATFRFSFYGDVTASGSSCAGASTLIVFINTTDPNSGTQTSQTVSGFNAGSSSVTTSFTVNATGFNGAPGDRIPNSSSNGGAFSIVFRAKGASAIQYGTTFTPGTSCSPAPTYQLYPTLEQLSTN